MPTVFVKSYTRDNALALQQLWFVAQTEFVKRDFGIANPFDVVGVDYVDHGAIEVWENETALKWLKSEFVKLSHQNPPVILEYLKRYESELNELKKIWKTGALRTVGEFQFFLEIVERLMGGDLVLSYLGVEKQAQKDVYQLASRLRSQDHFFGMNDLVIRKSMATLYPKWQRFVSCLTLGELKGSLPPLSVCNQRFVTFVAASNGYQAVESLDSYAAKNPGFVFNGRKVPLEKPKTINGVCAQKGKAVGTVKIVRLIEDISKVKKGDVIVSPMTTPAFLPAIQKAAAIVTDEGGLLCHASIVAREMKIPCVISTKFASKILKDGDRVEVDAEKGIVKII